MNSWFKATVFILFVIFIAGCISEGNQQTNTNNVVQLNLANLYGSVTDLKGVPLENVSVELISNTYYYNYTTDSNGIYNLSEINADTYSISIKKEGYETVVNHNVIISEGYSYERNYVLTNVQNEQCVYYILNSSANYIVRYGFNGTIYRGNITYLVPYPNGSTYTVFPPEDGSLSFSSTPYLAGNKMLNWTINNQNGQYSYIQGHIYIDIRSTQTMQLFDKKAMNISDAANAQPNYLGSERSETYNNTTMIDPSNISIKSLAEQIKNETNSDDVWTVSRAMFIWLENNTVYYYGPNSKTYTQSASEVLSSRKGKCDELSYLYISMLRSVGVPARFIDGYWAQSSSNPSEGYIGHTWVEFYDGEWVPVEVTGAGQNVTDDLALNFAVSQPDHVQNFVDDGSDTSLSYGYGIYHYYYYKTPPTISSYVFYNETGYNTIDLYVCSNGTRSIVQPTNSDNSH